MLIEKVAAKKGVGKTLFTVFKIDNLQYLKLLVRVPIRANVNDLIIIIYGGSSKRTLNFKRIQFDYYLLITYFISYTNNRYYNSLKTKKQP